MKYLRENKFVNSYADFPLTLAHWPMASEHCRRTSDFLNYWPGLASGVYEKIKLFS